MRKRRIGAGLRPLDTDRQPSEVTEKQDKTLGEALSDLQTGIGRFATALRNTPIYGAIRAGRLEIPDSREIYDRDVLSSMRKCSREYITVRPLVGAPQRFPTGPARETVTIYLVPGVAFPFPGEVVRYMGRLYEVTEADEDPQGRVTLTLEATLQQS